MKLKKLVLCSCFSIIAACAYLPIPHDSADCVEAKRILELAKQGDSSQFVLLAEARVVEACGKPVPGPTLPPTPDPPTPPEPPAPPTQPVEPPVPSTPPTPQEPPTPTEPACSIAHVNGSVQQHRSGWIYWHDLEDTPAGCAGEPLYILVPQGWHPDGFVQASGRGYLVYGSPQTLAAYYCPALVRIEVTAPAGTYRQQRIAKDDPLCSGAAPPAPLPILPPTRYPAPLDNIFVKVYTQPSPGVFVIDATAKSCGDNPDFPGPTPGTFRRCWPQCGLEGAHPQGCDEASKPVWTGCVPTSNVWQCKASRGARVRVCAQGICSPWLIVE